MIPPERQQNNQVNRKPQEIKQSLIDVLKGIFRSASAEKEERAREYLDRPSEQITAQTDISPEKKVRFDTQKARLDDLKQTLNQQGGPEVLEVISTQTQRVAEELGNKSDIVVFQSSFYKQMAKLSIDEEHTLPFARYIAKSVEQITNNDQTSSIRQKAELALEVFVGETGETATALPTLKKIIDGITTSHDRNKVRAYFESEDFPNLARKYGLTEGQITELKEEVARQEAGLNDKIITDESVREHMSDVKQEILKSISDSEQRAKVDVFLLSLPPEKIRLLLKSIPEKVKYEGRGMLRQNSPEETRQSLDSPDNKNESLHIIEGWINEFTAAQGEALTPEQTESIKQYLLGVRNEYFLTFMRNFPPTIYDSANPFRNWMNNMDDDLIVTTLAMMSQSDFMFVEYFRGKIAQFLAGQPERLAEFLDKARAAKNGSREAFSINNFELFDHIMQEVTQSAFYQMGENFRGETYRIIDGNIKNMKTRAATKKQTTLGGVDINFRYTQKEEVSEFGMELTREKVYNEGSLAYATATFMSRTKQLQEVNQNVGEFVKAVEQGKTEDLLTAAGKIDNRTMDFLGQISPIVRTAASAYIRVVRDKIQFNGGQLPPDMFANKDYLKNVIDRELDYNVKTVYDPKMTDEERDIYVRLGKALAFTSGEFQNILANALPPMTALIDRSNMSAELKNKLKTGEKLDLLELKIIAKELKPEFRDFPYRSLLMAMNPVRWLYAWIKDDDYGLFQLGFNPLKPGEEAIDWANNFDNTRAIMNSAFFGLDEKAVKFFDGTYSMPFYKLTSWNHKISLEKRGGVRRLTVDILRRHLSEVSAGGENKLDGKKSMDILKHYSPMLAYRFLTDPPNPNVIDVDWSNSSVDEETEKLFTYMHEYYPTFFIGLEQPHFFRRNELSFVQNIRQYVLQNLDADDQNRTSGYWKMLSREERESEGRIMGGHDPTFMGAKSEHKIAISRDITERMASMLREAELYLQEERIKSEPARKIKLELFFKSENPQTEFPELYNKLVNKIIKQRKGWHSLEASNEELFGLVKQFANDVFYKDQSSLYSGTSYLGNSTDGKKLQIKDYYLKLLNQKMLENPFNWAYLNQAEFNFQGTGIGMVGRNMNDFKTIMEATGYFGELTGSVNDAISQPAKSQEIIEKAFDNLGKKLWELKGSHGLDLSAEIGWLMSAYTMYPFTPSRMRDLPLAGLLGSTLKSWGNFYNDDDIFRALVWDSAKRKKVVDKWLQSPITKHILNPHQKDLKTIGLKETIDVPLVGKVKLPTLLRKYFGKQTKEVYPSGDEYKRYTVDNLKKFAKIESWWVGGRENLGIGYNTLMTIMLYGLIFMFVQAFREGLKSAESK